MDFNYLKKYLLKPGLYEPGDATMWTDEHISKELLKIHLNPELDLATRKPESISRTMEFITKHCHKLYMDVLDLGCGPGIYAEKLSLLGHQVTGVDFSKNSIQYAEEQSREKHLEIRYLCRNYLELDFHGQFDLVMLIYTDFGVLLPEERDKMLDMAYRSLKPGGILLFDVNNDRNMEQKSKEYQVWKFEDKGFWRNYPYLELSGGFYYARQRVFLNQHVIIDEQGEYATYRFWVHFFKTGELKELLLEKGFTLLESNDTVLPEGNIWNGNNVTFLACTKPV